MNSFTEESVRRSEGLKNLNKSIHPFGRKGFNMSKQKRQSTIDRAMRGIETHLERHPNDGVQKTYYDKLSKMTGI